MRKLTLWSMMFVLLLTMAAPGAYAEGPFRVVGYDHRDTQHDWNTNLFFDRMEEKTGVELTLKQYTTPEEWTAAKAEILSGKGEMPDALFKADLTAQEIQQGHQNGVLIDLAPYLQEHCPNLWALLESHPEWKKDVTLPDGAIVTLPQLDELQFNNSMWINTTWLEALKMEAPTTAEELTEVLRAFKSHDMNRNGKSDEIPLTFTSLWDLRFLAHAFGINANDYYVTMGEDGTVREVLTSDENRAFLTWLHDLWTEGLLDQDGFSGVRNLNLSAQTQNDAPVVYGMMFSSSPMDLVNAKNVSQYAILDPLVYEGKQVYRDLTGDVIRGTFAITSACKDPVTLLKWVDYFYSEEGFILAEAGQEGIEYEVNDDGTWLWIDTGDMLLNSILPGATIRSGASMPGYASIPFQLRIDNSATVDIINELLRLKQMDSLPYPLVWLTAEEQARIDELHYALASYAEQQMTWFVAGDVPLNDETWQAFCEQVKALNVDEMVSIWQSAADARK